MKNRSVWALVVLLIAVLGGGGMLILVLISYPHDCLPPTPGVDYQVGETSGLEVGFYDAGAREFETHYRDGWRYGEHTEWHPTGDRKQHGFYDSGTRIGTWEAWFQGGARNARTHYDDGGLLHGEVTGWFWTGELAYRGVYERGQPVGTQERWHSNGCPEELSRHDARGDVSVQYWYSNGDTRLLTAPVPGSDDMLRYTFYGRGGRPEADGRRRRSGGGNVGAWRFWDEAGELDAVQTGFYWRGWRLSGLSATDSKAPVPRAPERLLAPVGSGPITYGLHAGAGPRLPQWPVVR